MNIEWNETESGAYQGMDEDGNRFFSPASRETVNVELPDGRIGSGRTAPEALENALKKHPIGIEERATLIDLMFLWTCLYS